MCLLEVMTFHLLFDIHLADKNGFSYFNIAYIWQTLPDRLYHYYRSICVVSEKGIP